ncbi:general secretion pathway protein GspF [bacterium SCSIO 12696]|nr:general secretion pathway protein GspF [bacterium SCSIO 12696]
MIIKKQSPRAHGLNEPLFHADHSRPVTRRDFLAQGFCAGAGTVLGGSVLSLFASPRKAHALSQDLIDAMADAGCSSGLGAGKIPFICFDLAGGVNVAGSNVLIGGQGGQMDFLSTAGYSKLGLPGDMIPGVAEVNGAGSSETGTSNGDHTDTTLGLAFHSDSSFLRGILEKLSPGTAANINGAIIPARSENDTGNNPHNPMYGIATAGAEGSILSLIGSRSSDSGGNSMAPMAMIDPTIRPTKVDRPTDVTGMVDIGDLVGLLNQSDAVAVMESVYRLSNAKLGAVNTRLTNDAVIKDLIECGYLSSADLAERFGDPNTLNPDDRNAPNPIIVSDNGGIFSTAEFDGEGEFRKTASVMKMVIDGFAGAGTITMGGYDYHTGERATGEIRDLRAGRCMGACLEYAARTNTPLMMYVMSDGSVASNGRIDNSVDGRGKGEWTGDNQSTASSFFMVYNPNGRPQLLGATPEEQARHQQIGFMRNDASVETAATPAANNVNLLVETVILNYMALHGEQGNFANLFPANGLGNSALMDSLTAFQPIVNGTI